MTLAELGREVTRLREALSGPYPYQVEEAIRHEFGRLGIEREARRRLDAQEYAEAAGERRDLSFAKLAAQPRPEWIMPGYLTQGVYGVGGPPESGKSLLVRNWLCWLAAQGNACVYAISEGQHDVSDRFTASPHYRAAEPNLWLFDGPLSLASREDLDWFTKTYTDRQPRLIVFDMIYGFGLPDDTGMLGVAPVINGCKRLAAELGAAVVITGHPPLNGDRRFRGSGMWRGAFDGEYHLADGIFTCEKHKYADKRRLRWPYQVEFPALRTLGGTEAMDRHAQRAAAISSDFAAFPRDTITARAKRLAPGLGVSADYLRRLIRDFTPEDQDT